MLDCYAAQLNQAFFNVINNGIDALEEAMATGHFDDQLQDPNFRPTLMISTRRSCRAESLNSGTMPTITVRIKDNAKGIPLEIQSHIFNPFYTTKPPGQGTGLGLSISYQIVVDRHQGNLTFHSQPGQGTEFVITLPLP